MNVWDDKQNITAGKKGAMTLPFCEMKAISPLLLTVKCELRRNRIQAEQIKLVRYVKIYNVKKGTQ
jgi:hypothetical protein